MRLKVKSWGILPQFKPCLTTDQLTWEYSPEGKIVVTGYGSTPLCLSSSFDLTNDVVRLRMKTCSDDESIDQVWTWLDASGIPR